jgi:hypothetical protein
MPDQSTVEYRNIPEFPGYRVGDDGSVWTCWKRIGLGNPADKSKRRGTAFVLSDEWKLMKATPNEDGYPTIGLYRNGKVKRIKTSVLVLMAFVGPKGFAQVPRPAQ